MKDTKKKKPQTLEEMFCELTQKLKASLAALDSDIRVVLEEAKARDVVEQRRKAWGSIESESYVAFSIVEVGDIIAFAHPQNDIVKAFRPYIVVPNNPSKRHALVRFSLHGDGSHLYQQNERSWKEDGGYIIHRPANVAALEAESASLREQLAEAKKDTERLEWLYSMGRSMDIVPPSKGKNDNKGEWRVFIDEWLASSGETPRAAIDAAMKQNDGERP